METILVTGAGGYIGSHITKRLLKDGYKVIAFDNFSRGFREPLQILSKYGSLEVKEGDLKNESEILKVFRESKIDAVMHLAALCSVDESVKNPDLYIKNNVLGTSNLLSAMKMSNVNIIIFSSTCAIYGNAKYLPIDELHLTAPQNPYGQSKLFSEDEIKKSSLRYVIFRYFNVTGADEEGEMGDSKKPSELLLQNAVRGALKIAPFFLTAPEVHTYDGTPVRDYVNVEDIVDAHIKALKYLQAGNKSEIINLGTGSGSSVKEILETAKKELRMNFDIKKSPVSREGEVPEIYASIEKAQRLLAWRPQKTIKDSIQSLKKWYEKHPQGYKE